MKRAGLAFLLFAALGPLNARAARMPVFVSDEQGRPVEDAVVFVESASGTFKAPEQPYVMDQVDKELIPHVLPILVGGRVRFPNDDDIHHQLYSFSPAKTFELPLYKGEPAQPLEFPKVGVVKLGCNIHDWMSGIILVLPNPYFAKTGADGKAVLELPEGQSEVSVFHERLKGPQDAARRKVSPEPGRTLEWRLSLKAERRSSQLADSVALLGGDFAFKQAVATRDPATIASAAGAGHHGPVGALLGRSFGAPAPPAAACSVRRLGRRRFHGAAGIFLVGGDRGVVGRTRGGDAPDRRRRFFGARRGVAAR